MKPKLLIVDDEIHLLELLDEIFGQKFDVETCESGFDAVRVAGEFQPDVILTDYHCPRETDDGGRLCAAVKKIYPHISVVMMSSEHDLGPWLMETYGADAFIPKPFKDIGELMETVESFASATR